MKNKNDVNVMLKEAGILFAITLIAGLLLGAAYELTKEPIRIQQEKAIQEACAKVFETADSFAEIEYTPGTDLSAELSATGVELGSVYEAHGADGKLLGYVLETTSSQGYGGDIVLYMGVAMDGTLNGISILEISETPGLGALAPEILVPQFADRKADSFVYTKSGAVAENEIDAISGATVTTEAITEAVNGGLKAVKNLIGGGSNE